jgi:hypothetical protein
MEILKRVSKAFVFGACVGLAGQICLLLAGSIVPDATLATIIAMLLVGLIGALLIATGIYDKLAGFAGFGEDQPVCGLMYGAANMARGALSEGAPMGKSFFKGFIAIALIVGIGFIIPALIAIVIVAAG